METKKSKKVDLKNKSSLFFQIGIIAALGIVFAAFQWSVDEKMDFLELTSNLNANIEEEFSPITRPEVEEQKKKEPPVVEVITIVDDEVEDIDDIFVAETEGDQSTAIKMITMDTGDDDIIDDVIFMIVEEMPKYPGGNAALLRDIMSNVIYPEIAKENGIQGRVFVGFVVNSDGFVEKVTLKRGVDPSLDAEALRVVKNIKKWTPGKQRGKNVKVAFTVPINFKLN